jgi:hypothetical protein
MAPKYERLTPEREEAFRDWARCHNAVHPGELLAEIDALRIELEEARRNQTCIRCRNEESK